MKRLLLPVLVLMALLGSRPLLAGEQTRICDVDIFLDFLAAIDDGLGPQPLPEPPGDAMVLAGTQHDLGIVFDLQRKDSPMLCLECYDETGTYAWDTSHPDQIGPSHGYSNCARASIKMINSYYGGSLSQDRITYYIIAEYPAPWAACGLEYQLWHEKGGGVEALPWALGFAKDDWSKITRQDSKPTYAQIKAWIDAGRPIRVDIPGHSMVIDGYWEDGAVNRVHLLDPWCNWDGNESHPGTGWRDYSGGRLLTITGVDVCPTPDQVPSPRSEEASVWTDSDGDGICDFDELYRFLTSPWSSDSDGDGVPDKKEIRSYVFDAAGSNNLIERIGDIWVCSTKTTHDPCGWVYNQHVAPIPWASQPDTYACPNCGNHKRSGGVNGFSQTLGPASPLGGINWSIVNLVIANADPDGDGLRAERDPDSDNDGALDGEEDVDHDGIYEPGLGESDPFDRFSYHSTNPCVIKADQALMATRYAVVNGNLYIHGNLICSGNKAEVPTKSYGRRQVNVEESAESYHFDRGQSRLSNGSVTIHLDPMFAQTVTIDAEHPPLVRLTATADCKGLYVARSTPTSFTVKEADGGTSSATFNWELAAKRAGHADRRLEPFAPIGK